MRGVRAPGGTPPIAGGSWPFTNHAYVRRPASPNVGRPAFADSTIDHGSTNASHTPIAIAEARSPGRRVATSSVAEDDDGPRDHERLRERRDAERDAEHDGMAHAVDGSSRRRSSAPNATNAVAAFRMSGVVSSSGVIVSAKKPNSAYAAIAPARPDSADPRTRSAMTRDEQVLERREHRDEAHEVDRVHHRDLGAGPARTIDPPYPDEQRVERTPIEIGEAGPLSRDDGVAEVEIGNAVGADDESLRVRLERGEGEQDRPRGHPDRARHAR